MRVVIFAVFFAVATVSSAPVAEVSAVVEDSPAIADSPTENAHHPYSFAWEVKDEESKNDYAHSESSDGKVVTGSYRVVLPDGRLQIVTYRADANGYTAQVKYKDVPTFPSF